MAASNNTDNLGSEFIDFSLIGVDGEIYSSDDFKNAEVLIIIFMCNHCPYVKGIIDRFTEFQNKYKSRNVQLAGINSNDTVNYPEDSFENMKLFSSERKMNFPYLFDESQEIAKKYKAGCTPDIFVYDKNRILKYRGRFDDNWKDETAVKEKDLEKAVIQLLENKEINFTQIPSIGCSIKWKL